MNTENALLPEMLLNYCLNNPTYFQSIKDYIITNGKKSYFDDVKYQLIFNLAGKFFRKYNAFPSVKEFNILTSGLDDDDEIKLYLNTIYENANKPFTGNPDFIKTQFKSLIETVRITEAIAIGTAQYYETNNIEALIESIREAKLPPETDKNVMFDIGMGADFSFIQEILEQENKVGKIKTLYPDLDTILDGGFSNSKLYLFAGIAGGGKSIMLLQLALNACKQGKNVLYVSYEMDKRVMTYRTILNLLDDAINSKMDLMMAYTTNKADTVNTVQKAYSQLKGKFEIVCPIELGQSASDIEKYLEANKFDIAVIDYIGIMEPSSKGSTDDNPHFKYKKIAEELRALSKKFDIPVITANQLNADGYKKQTLDLTNMAYSTGIGHTLDFVCAINPDGETLSILKNRDGIACNLKIKMEKSKYKILGIYIKEDKDKEEKTVDDMLGKYTE